MFDWLNMETNGANFNTVVQEDVSVFGRNGGGILLNFKNFKRKIHQQKENFKTYFLAPLPRS